MPQGRATLSCLSAVYVVLIAAACAIAADKQDPADPDELLLREASVPTDSASLITFMRLRTDKAPPEDAIKKRIEKLQSGDPAERTSACWELIAIGKPALPLLGKAGDDLSDKAAKESLRRCQRAIAQDQDALILAAVRILAQRRTGGVAPLLLDFLPRDDVGAFRDELQEALNALAFDTKGTADKVVIDALKSADALQRIAAVKALTQDCRSLHRDAVRKLMHDSDPRVRVATALALAQGYDSDAIDAMIALLGELDDLALRAPIEGFLSDLAAGRGPKIDFGQDRTTRKAAAEAWKDWWRGTQVTGLVDDLKKRVLTDTDINKVKALIQKLGNDNYEVRERAEAGLMHMGTKILPILDKAEFEPDLEIHLRMDKCLAALRKLRDEERGTALVSTAARLIAMRKAPGAVDAILEYLPSLGQVPATDEWQLALDAVAMVDGKPDPAIGNALTDQQWIRRVCAARALCVVGRTEDLKLVRPLLRDDDATVRLNVAEALLLAQDATGVPEIIAQIATLPAEQSREVEGDYLKRLAGKGGPSNLIEGPKGREQRSQAWAAWWRDHKDQVAVADAFPRPNTGFIVDSLDTYANFTYLLQPETNSVTVLGTDGKPRCKLTDLSQPQDLQVLPGGRLLLAERQQVTERTLSGKVVWKCEASNPQSVQRLKNGHTLMVCDQSEILEVDRSGKQTMLAQVRCMAARRLPDGNIVAFDRGNVIQLDGNGKLVKSTGVQCGGAGWNSVLDNGHVLALSPGNGNIIEFDADGQQVGRFEYPGAFYACRMPNRHTLITHQNASEYIEIDENWKLVKTTELDTLTLKVLRR